MTKPILDPIPSTKPHDYSLRAIRKAQMAPAPVTLEPFPEEWHNPNQKWLAHRGQSVGGTCTGQAAAYGLRHNYIKLTGDIPTEEQMANIQRDVKDAIGTLIDILPENEISSEAMYQMGRYIGNITYPSGGEIRFVAKAARDWGYALERQWHSDKSRECVWVYPPGVVGARADVVGIDQTAIDTFAADHRIKGWAMVGTPDGDATWDEIRAAIYKYGWVMCAIPIYTNFSEMQGQERPVYPYPNGELDGFHAQIVDGYSPDALDIEHSWYGWCGQHGLLPKEYYTYARDQCIWLVYIDDEEVKIGKETHITCNITSNVPAMISVNGVNIGTSPQKIALIKSTTYIINATAEGYIAQSRTVDDSVTEVSFTLEAVVEPQPVKGWLEVLRDFWKFLIALFKR
jgi:hypothetical protein